MSYKVKVLIPCAGSFGAFTKGDTPTLSEQIARSLCKSGLAEEIDKLPQEEDEGEKEGNLPKDFPARDLLLEEGINTLDLIRSHGDLTQVIGIGKATVKEINEYLKNIE